MGLWKTVRREVAGAWRSARYDVDRHVGHHRAMKLQHAETAEIVVREIVWQRRPSPGRHHRTPDMPWAGRRPTTPLQSEAVPIKLKAEPIKQRRRAVAATGVALLVAGGTAGTYLAIAGSLVGGTNSQGQEPAQAAPAEAKESPVSHTQPTPARGNHRRAAPAPNKPTNPNNPNNPYNPNKAINPIQPADIRPVVPPAPTPTTSIEATPTPTSTPSATPTPSPSVSTTTTDEADGQVTDGHRWRHRGQTRNGR